jgi:hypothetical protein
MGSMARPVEGDAHNFTKAHLHDERIFHILALLEGVHSRVVVSFEGEKGGFKNFNAL